MNQIRRPVSIFIMLILCVVQGFAIAHDYEHALSLHDVDYEQCQLFDSVINVVTNTENKIVDFQYESLNYSGVYFLQVIPADICQQLIRAPPVSIF